MQKPKILLIEDEEDIAALIKLQAEMSGYRLIVEVDGLNGLRAVEKEKPDLVILDLMLPGQSGLDVCRKIKTNPDLKDIPVIMISAKSEELDVVLGLELGADDYVTKPFSPKILFSRVRQALRHELGARFRQCAHQSREGQRCAPIRRSEATWWPRNEASSVCTNFLDILTSPSSDVVTRLSCCVK